MKNDEGFMSVQNISRDEISIPDKSLVAKFRHLSRGEDGFAVDMDHAAPNR